MSRKTRWTNKELIAAVLTSKSIRQVLSKLHLAEAGGNYEQIKKQIALLKLNRDHFTGRAWNKGLRYKGKPQWVLEEILVPYSTYQSFKLKNRLFQANLKKPKCEECGWAKKTEDGRIPVELDHINGNRYDNRLENLRVLCPNCHSLKLTHRGLNRNNARVV